MNPTGEPTLHAFEITDPDQVFAVVEEFDRPETADPIVVQMVATAVFAGRHTLLAPGGNAVWMLERATWEAEERTLPFSLPWSQAPAIMREQYANAADGSFLFRPTEVAWADSAAVAL